MSIECEKRSGINLSQGVCDTETPKVVREAAQKAIDLGLNSYTRYDGLRQLRRAIASKLRSYNSIEADPETEITVSGGSTGAFYCACLGLLDPGDEVILFEPFYGYHVNTLLAVDVVPVSVPTHPPVWEFDPADLERVVTPKTRAIVVCTPSNPSGKVFSRTELESIADFACRHDLFVFTDEIYEYFIYDGSAHTSPGSIPRIADRTVTISGYSKTFSITGWRIGYSVSRPEWAKTIGYMNDVVYVCGPAPLQDGVAVGITQLSREFYQALSSIYRTKRDHICDSLSKAGLHPHVPQGAYYVLADASRLPGENSKEKAMFLLDETGIAAVPGDAFFTRQRGKNLLRFCFAKEDDELLDACGRLEGLG